MLAAPNVSADHGAPPHRPRHTQSVAVGIALGVAWLAMRPMLTGLGLALVGAVAAVPAAWTSRRRWRNAAVSASEQPDNERRQPPDARLPGRVERTGCDRVPEIGGGTSMITCVEQLISEYVDGDLSPPVARELEDHLRVCAECRVLLVDYCALVAATHLLAANKRGTGDHGRSPMEMLVRNGLGQARTSDLLA